MSSPDARLAELCGASGLEVGADQCSALVRLLELLEQWGAVMRLTSIGGQDAMIVRHVLDSLLLTEVVTAPSSFVDVGSGNGFPGLALALMWPDAQAHLIDARRKSCAFLTEAARVLGAANVSIWHDRAEADGLRERVGNQPLAVCRGLTPRGSVGAVVGPWVAPDGVAAVYTGPDGVGVDARAGFAALGMKYQRQVIVPAGGTEWSRRFELYAYGPTPLGVVSGEPLECFT